MRKFIEKCKAATPLLFPAADICEVPRKGAAVLSHEPDTMALISIFENDAKLKSLMVKSIAQAKEINPDPFTNPAQTLEEFYCFLDWAAKCMPWNIIHEEHMPHSSLFDKIDSGMNYFYFMFDQPLKELEGRGLYYNSIQYEAPIYKWITRFARNWGKYLSTPESWCDKYYQICLGEPQFGLQNDWYESHENWRTFNDFFARELKSPDARPLAEADDRSVVTAPADSTPRGVWRIDDESNILNDEGDSGVAIKSSIYNSVRTLLGARSKYRNAFAGGTLTHTYLNEGDYHHFHFPFSGRIVESHIIRFAATGGGVEHWDPRLGLYVLDDRLPGWQALETRGLVIIDTEEYGLAAVMPIGMAQVGSVVFEKNVKPGAVVKKGDKLGYFLFGGSDTVMLFQRGVKFELTAKPFEHLLMGERYGKLTKA